MKLAQAVGERTKELLFEKNITQYRLAKTTCLSEKTLSDLLKSKTADVKFSTIYLITEALGVGLIDFFNSPLFNQENIDL